jgi:assimilatory nitrate reductase catalytic subunit
MHPRDMERREIAEGDLVTLKNKRGSLRLRATASPSLRPSHIYLPMHWGGQFMRGARRQCTDAGRDRPGLAPARAQARGGAGGKIRRRLAAGGPAPRRRRDSGDRACSPGWNASTPLRWPLPDASIACSCCAPGAPPARRRPTRATLADLAAALRASTARRRWPSTTPGAASAKRALIEDERTGRRPALQRNPRHRLARRPDCHGRPIRRQHAELRKWIFAPLAAPPSAAPARGRIVCNCFDVSENEIRADYAAGLDLAALQEKRKCGSSCGSCLPELKRLAVTPR